MKVTKFIFYKEICHSSIPTVKYRLFAIKKFLRFNENAILVHINFGVHDMPWVEITNKIRCNVTVFLPLLLLFIL